MRGTGTVVVDRRVGAFVIVFLSLVRDIDIAIRTVDDLEWVLNLISRLTGTLAVRGRPSLGLRP